MKRVRCLGHGPIFAGSHYRSGWEDVWLRWKGKPGRTIYRAAPCLISSGDLRGEIESCRWMLERHPGKYDRHYQQDIAANEAILARLTEAPYWADDADCPNVYTRTDYIDRAEAERMIAWFLADRYGVKRPKLDWQRPEIVVIPWSLTAPQAGE